MMLGLVLAKQQQIYKVLMINLASSQLPDMAKFGALIATHASVKKSAIRQGFA
jgi:hypothetical protein